MNQAYLRALSFYLPENELTNEKLVSEFPDWNAEKVSAKVGVFSRRVAAADETAGDLAEMAAKTLFEEYGISPEEVDFLILCTQSPDYFLPSTACVLQDRLGIPTNAGALDIDLGCSGCVYALSLAQGLIMSQSASNVLILTAETYTKYLHHDDVSNRSIFGDGAAACMVSTHGLAKIGRFVFGTDGSGANHLIVKTGSARHRQPTGLMQEDSEGHLWRDDFLYMNGGAIFNFTLDAVPPLINSILERNEMQKDEIDHYVFHQANKFMLNTIRKVAALPCDKFYVNIENTGNTVSSTIFIALKQCLDSGEISHNEAVMIAGFGVGLSWAGTILHF